MDREASLAHELTRFQALTDKTWNPPALDGELLLVRNDKEAECFRLPLAAKQDLHAAVTEWTGRPLP